MIGKYFCLNGKFQTTEKAVLPIDNIEFTYGFGVYENLRLRKGKLYFVHKHVERLFLSAKYISLQHKFKPRQVEGWIKTLVKKNGLQNANIKMLLIGAGNVNDVKLYILMLAPKYLDKKYYRKGVKVITYNHERFLPQAKTLNMLANYLIFKRARKKGAYDALVFDNKGYVNEGTRSNFFVIKNKTLYTAPLKYVLDGVTRRTVIDCAKQNGYKVKEKLIRLKDLFKYDGAFLTNTSGKIVPIRKIDNKSFIEIAEELKHLMKFYNEYLK